MLKLDTCFRRNYECDVLVEIPHGDRFYYPGASTQGGSDGPIVRVLPHSEDSWVGVFAFGRSSMGGATGLFTFPDPDIVCVVARGNGYVVHANDPHDWNEIEVYPVCSVIPVESWEIIVFADYTSLTAIGASGVVWTTKRLALSRMKLLTVTDNVIEGETWDDRSERDVRFQVELSSGRHNGGITGF